MYPPHLGYTIDKGGWGLARQFDNREKMADLFFAINMNRGLSLELLFNIATVLEIEPYLLLKFSPEK